MVQQQTLVINIIGVFTFVHARSGYYYDHMVHGILCNKTKLGQQVLGQCSLFRPTWTGIFGVKCNQSASRIACSDITYCNCERRTLLEYFKKKIAGANSTNFLEVSKELASSGEVSEFTNTKVFHELNKELFNITSRFLKPLTLENADLAVQYYSGFIDTMLRSPQYNRFISTGTICHEEKLTYERNSLAFKALEFLRQAPNKTKAHGFGWMFNIMPAEDRTKWNYDTCLLDVRLAASTSYLFKKKVSVGVTGQPLLLKVNMASLVIVEETTTRVDITHEKNVTSGKNTNQNTTRTTHNNSEQGGTEVFAKPMKEGLTNEQLNELLRENHCNSLTIMSSSQEENFVVFKEIVSSENLRQEKVQSYLEIALLCISIAAVILAYVLLTLAARVKNSEKFYIPRSLLFSVGVGNLVFVLDTTLFASRHDHSVLCSAVAVVQHYLHTAIFTWMLVEGINLYSKLVKIFDVKRPYALYSAIGWGIPAVIAGVVAAISPNTFDMTEYETVEITCGTLNLKGTNLRTRCWMNGNLWIYKGPILAILLVNFVLYVIFLCIIFGKLSSDYGNNQVIVAKKGLKSIIALLPLLGVTWLLGFFIQFHYLLAYIFIVLNSTQGIAFFIFYCVLDEQVRGALRKFLAKDGHKDKVTRTRETPATNKPSHHTIP